MSDPDPDDPYPEDDDEEDEASSEDEDTSDDDAAADVSDEEDEADDEEDEADDDTEGPTGPDPAPEAPPGAHEPSLRSEDGEASDRASAEGGGAVATGAGAAKPREAPETKPREAPETKPREAPETKPAANTLRIIAISDLVIGVLLIGAVWGVLPARWLPVDAIFTLLGIGFVVVGAGLWIDAPWARRAAKIVAGTSLTIGALLCTALAFTAAHISGLYGPVGAGGALLLFVVALLIVPYLVLVPAAQLWVLLGRGGARP